jgi:hypothetical protein
MRRALLLCAAVFGLAASGAQAAPGPYDETADAKAQIQAALADARKMGEQSIHDFFARLSAQAGTRR